MKNRFFWLVTLGVVLAAGLSWYAWSNDSWWREGRPDFSFLRESKTEKSNINPSELVINFLAHSALTDLQITEVGTEMAQVNGLAGINGAPPAPSGLMVLDLKTGDSLRLTWSLPIDQSRTAVEVWRGSDSVNQSLLVSLPADTESFTDSSLKTGETYWYTVAVRSGEVLSVKSDAISASSSDITPPPPPRDVTLSRLSEGSGFRLNWVRAEISEPVTYRVWRSEKPEERGVMLAESIDGLTYDDAGATSGTTYWYRVTAVDNIGNESVISPLSSSLGHTPLLGSPPPPAEAKPAKLPPRR